MKRLISGILCAALAATCFCGCGKASNEDNTPSDLKDTKKTFYLLKEVVNKNDDGEVMYRAVYGYDQSGWVTSFDIDNPKPRPVWNEEAQLYESVLDPCDGSFEKKNAITYDQKGNIVNVCGDHLGEGKWSYQYSYDESGKITNIDYYYENETEPKRTLVFEYLADGSIELRDRASGDLDAPYRRWETNGDLITKMEWYDDERLIQYYFEYDKAGNMTNFHVDDGYGEMTVQGTRTYDEQGRILSEEGFTSGGEPTSYQYSGDQLVAINGNSLEYTTNADGQMVVKFMGYEMTYEAVELTNEEIAQVRYKWNWFCSDLNDHWHHFRRGMDGIHYPVYDTNTALLLPNMFISLT